MVLPDFQSTRAREAGDARVSALMRRIQQRTALVGVVGQGYVGYPLAQRTAAQGFATIGFDIDSATVAARALESTRTGYRASCEVADLRACDVIVVAVPTPTRRTAAGPLPDLEPVLKATRMLIADVLTTETARLLIYESTYAPGTTRRAIAPLLMEWLAPTGDLWLGYSPERIDPGNQHFDLANTPKITSGYDLDAARLTQRFYSALVADAVAASSLEAAEATKMLENAFRFVNIAFAQEFDSYCERAGLSAREITDLAATKPFGFLPFYAGAGIGGHCIAEDPYYLEAAMREAGVQPAILRAALSNHEQRAAVIVERIRARLPGQTLRDSRILLLGVTYKPNVADVRRSPALDILRQLEAAGAIVAYHDPLVARFAGRSSQELAGLRPSDVDLGVLITAHASIDHVALAREGWPLYDTRGNIVHLRTSQNQQSGRVAK